MAKNKNTDWTKRDVENIRELTQDNDHTGARLYIANLIKVTRFKKIYSAIQQIQSMEYGIPDEIYQYRNNIDKQLMYYGNQMYGNDWKEIENAL